MQWQYLQYIFTQEAIKIHAPNVAGIFGLYDSPRFEIYYGKSDKNLEHELLDHLRGAKGPCTKAANYFNVEIATNTSKRLKELLDEHKVLYEKLPECDESL